MVHGPGTLLTLPPYRVARELRHAAAAEEDARVYRQRLTRIIMQWMAGYAVGLFIIGLAFRVYDPSLEIAPTFLAIGQIVCAGSTVTTVFRFWKILG